MLNRPKARTRGYSCPLDENVARSILHKTIAIESKMIHQSYQTAQNEAARVRRAKRIRTQRPKGPWLKEQSEFELRPQKSPAFGERSESEPKQRIKSNRKPSVVQGAKRIRTTRSAAPPPQRSKSKANLSKRPKGVNQGPGHAPVNQRAAPWRVQLT